MQGKALTHLSLTSVYLECHFSISLQGVFYTTPSVSLQRGGGGLRLTGVYLSGTKVNRSVPKWVEGFW